MRHHITATILVIALFPGLATGLPDSAATGPTLHTDAPQLTEHSQRAFGRFENTGVSVPAISIGNSAAAPTIHAPDLQLEVHAEWALGRFESAGLNVPAIEIHLHHTNELCGGNRGIFSPGRDRVDVCVDDQMVLLHEIAHAWAHDHLTPRQRGDYVAAGGFESWNDPDTAWSDRGSEDAAHTIAWALLERPIRLLTPDGPIAQRNEAYRLLTGSDAPRLVTEGA